MDPDVTVPSQADDKSHVQAEADKLPRSTEGAGGRQQGGSSRLITVVSREDSPEPEALPFAQSWGSSSKPLHKFLSQNARSLSMTDVRGGGGQRRNPHSLHPHWKRGESRVLPSCQANPRRSPLSGRSSRSTTPDLVRLDSDDSFTTCGRQSTDSERSLSFEMATGRQSTDLERSLSSELATGRQSTDLKRSLSSELTMVRPSADLERSLSSELALGRQSTDLERSLSSELALGMQSTDLERSLSSELALGRQSTDLERSLSSELTMVRPSAGLERSLSSGLAMGRLFTDLERSLSSELATGRQSTDCERHLSSELTAGVKQYTELERSLSSESTTGARQHADLERSLSSVLPTGRQYADLEKSLSSDLTTGRQFTDLERSVSSELTTEGRQYADIERNLSSVLATERQSTDFERSLSSEVITGKQYTDLERSLSSELAPSLQGHSRNKSDSGIVTDDYIHSFPLSPDIGTPSESVFQRRSAAPVDSSEKQKIKPSANKGTEYDPTSRLYYPNPRAVVERPPRPPRHRYHSESELSGSPSQVSKTGHLGDTCSRLSLHRSWESLSVNDTTASIFPGFGAPKMNVDSLSKNDSASILTDFQPNSFGAPAMDVDSQAWGRVPTTQSYTRTDSMEPLCDHAGTRLHSGSADEDGDDVPLAVSWTSAGWRQSVKARWSSLSSEGSVDDAFFSTGDSLGEMSESFQAYLKSKFSDSQSSAKNSSDKQRDINSKKESGTMGEHTERVRRWVGGLQEHDQLSLADKGLLLEGSSLDNSSRRENIAAKDYDTKTLNPSTHTSPEEAHGTEVYTPSESSSVLVPHLQKALEAVREHIKFKQSACPLSKIPVRVRKQISPRRHSGSRSGSREQSRRSSLDSSGNSVYVEQSLSSENSPPNSATVESVNVLLTPTRSTSERDLSVDNSRQRSTQLVSTAVILDEKQDVVSFGTKNDSCDDLSQKCCDSTDVNEDFLSVFSPRPPGAPEETRNVLSTPNSAEEAITKIHYSDTEISHPLNGPADKDSVNYNKSVLGPELLLRKPGLSPRSGREDVSPRSRNEARKYRRKTCSRVDFLLNNDLFKRNLSGHIDLVEKNILQIKKHGLKKSYSNLDLTVTDSIRLQAAFEASLKLQAEHRDESSGDKSSRDESEKTDETAPLQRCAETDSDTHDKQREETDSDTHDKQHSLTSTPSRNLKPADSSQTPRRKSIACDDPSLKQLQDVFRQGMEVPGAGFAAGSKRGRMHIPSFREFRKQRQKPEADSGTSTRGPDADCSDPVRLASGDSLDSMASNYRTLDTITEDDGMDTARSATCDRGTVPVISVDDVDFAITIEEVPTPIASPKGGNHMVVDHATDMRRSKSSADLITLREESRLQHVPKKQTQTAQTTNQTTTDENPQQMRIDDMTPRKTRSQLSSGDSKTCSNKPACDRGTVPIISVDDVDFAITIEEEFTPHASPKGGNHMGVDHATDMRRSKSSADLITLREESRLHRVSKKKTQTAKQTTTGEHPQQKIITLGTVPTPHANPKGAKHMAVDQAMDMRRSKSSADLITLREESRLHRVTKKQTKTAQTAKKTTIGEHPQQKRIDDKTTSNDFTGILNYASPMKITSQLTPADNDTRSNKPARKVSPARSKPPACPKPEADDSEPFLYRSSGSSDGTFLGEASEGEIVFEDGYDEVEKSPRSPFADHFPYPLFDKSAVVMDTNSWAQLFSKTRKSTRRKDGHKSRSTRRHDYKDQTPPSIPVLRSSSDVTAQTTSVGQAGQRKRRLRKERPYKSDPLADGGAANNMTIMNSSSNSSSSAPGGEEAGVVGFLAQRSTSRDSPAAVSCSFPSLEELTEESMSEDSECNSEEEDEEEEERSSNRLSNISTASEDSGVVGQDVSSPEPLRQPPLLHAKMNHCTHCNPCDVDLKISEFEDDDLLCDKCLRHQQERRNTIYEIIETEINYGRDLRILKEEFFTPMQTTGLLTPEQLDTVFVNLEDLIAISQQLTEKLRASLHNSAMARDQKLNLVNIGSLFIESSTMFLAFENYCVNQAQASTALEQLERERELLRIFLQVSQAENGVLRRMHLKSFLMVPVQRIMKYPLLLNRLHKATPAHHGDRDDIRQARERIEDILGHINAKAKGSDNVRIKRKQSELRRYSLKEKIEVNRVALDKLGWHKKEVSDLITSRMWFAQPADHTWASKRCRNVKFTSVHAVLLTLGQTRNDHLAPPNGQQAAVVLVREKNGKYQAVREPFMLDKSVVTVDPDCCDVFELQEWGKEAFIFKADDAKETVTWVQHLRQQTHSLGQWRRRRNALPNIMLKNV